MTQLGVLRQTLADYRKMRQACSDLAELQLVAARRERETVAADEALFERVTQEIDADGARGWARFRSELGWTNHPPPCFAKSGPPMAAEWMRRQDTDAGIAYRLTPAPNEASAMLIVSARHRTLSESDRLEDGEIACLRQPVTVLAHQRLKPFGRIAYDIYWGLPETDESRSAMRRLFDRFAGFEE